MRAVNTRFWDDPFVEELSASEKLLFLYLLTNPLTNLLGVYEITLRRICYDTGLQKETVMKGLERFGRVRKAFFVDNFIVLPNWLKNQNMNSNMKVAVVREFNALPKSIKNNILGNGSEGLHNDSEGFRTVMECLVEYEMEIEREIESEIEREIEKKDEIDFSAILKYYNEHCGALPKVQKLTDKRKKLIRARHREHGKEAIAKVIKMAAASNFLSGDSEKGWTANFDWVFNENNFVKIIEGNYSNKSQHEVPAKLSTSIKK